MNIDTIVVKDEEYSIGKDNNTTVSYLELVKHCIGKHLDVDRLLELLYSKGYTWDLQVWYICSVIDQPTNQDSGVLNVLGFDDNSCLCLRVFEKYFNLNGWTEEGFLYYKEEIESYIFSDEDFELTLPYGVSYSGQNRYDRLVNLVAVPWGMAEDHSLVNRIMRFTVDEFKSLFK